MPFCNEEAPPHSSSHFSGTLTLANVATRSFTLACQLRRAYPKTIFMGMLAPPWRNEAGNPFQ